MVQGSSLIVTNKIDVPTCVDVARSFAAARAFNPNLEVSRPSAETGEGPNDDGSGRTRRRPGKTAHRTFAAGNVTSSVAPQP